MVGSLTEWSDRGDTLVVAGKGNGGGAMTTDGELDITVVAGTNEDEIEIVMTGWLLGRVDKVTYVMWQGGHPFHLTLMNGV